MDFLDKKTITQLQKLEDVNIENFVLKLKRQIEKELDRAFSNISKKNISVDNLILELQNLTTLNLPKEIQSQINQLAKLYQEKLLIVSKMIREVNGIEKTIFNKKDELIINQMLELGKVNIITNIQQTYNEFKQVMFQAGISRELPNTKTVIDTLSARIETKLPTEINTQLAGFQRTIQLEKAEELGLTHFLYAGGIIETSRPFCQERAEKIFTLEEAKSWDNGQGLPVIPYLGGYRCRHTMVFMTKDKAISEGWNG